MYESEIPSKLDVYLVKCVIGQTYFILSYIDDVTGSHNQIIELFNLITKVSKKFEKSSIAKVKINSLELVKDRLLLASVVNDTRNSSFGQLTAFDINSSESESFFEDTRAFDSVRLFDSNVSAVIRIHDFSYVCQLRRHQSHKPGLHISTLI